MGAAVLHEVETTTSTQLDARRLADDGAVHGTAVLARRQDAARGRRGRHWQSDHDGLWLSVVLRPRVPIVLAPRLPLAACVVVLDLLEARGLDVHIKWPNDVLVPVTAAALPSPVLGPFRKAGGLLVEVVQASAARLDCCVLGLGLNLWRPPVGFGDLEGHAGALADIGFVGDDEARRALARALTTTLAATLGGPDAVDDGAFARVRQRLIARSATLGRDVVVDGVAGRAVDLDDDGALVLVDGEGARRVITAGDVALL